MNAPSLHDKIESAKILLLKEKEINKKTHNISNLFDSFNLSITELLGLAKEGLLKLDNYKLGQGYINEYRRKGREFGAKLEKLKVASLGDGGSSFNTHNPFADKHCNLGKGYYEKLINALDIELDVLSFQSLAQQEITQKFLSFEIKLSLDKVRKFLEEKIDSFMRDELNLAERVDNFLENYISNKSYYKTQRSLSYQRQKEDFSIAIQKELGKGYPPNSLKLDYTQIWDKQTILHTYFLETALGMEREGLIEIKDIIYQKAPYGMMIMTSDEFWKYPTIIQMKILPEFHRYYKILYDYKSQKADSVRKMVVDKQPQTTSKSEPKKEIVRQGVLKKDLLFPIPANTRWEDITLKFKNKFDVEVIIKGKKHESDYEKMGFADKRVKKTEEKTKANDAWDFLFLLSTLKGIFPIDSLTGKEKGKKLKQKQTLSKSLIALFPTIKDDPVEYNDMERNYKIKIKLIPEKTFRDDFRDRDIKFNSDDKSESEKIFDEMTENKSYNKVKKFLGNDEMTDS